MHLKFKIITISLIKFKTKPSPKLNGRIKVINIFSFKGINYLETDQFAQISLQKQNTF